MEGNEEKVVTKRNGLSNGLSKEIQVNIAKWTANITSLDLSNKDLTCLDSTISLPPNINNLNLSRNKLTEVPGAVLNLEQLRIIDLSCNSIEFFDDTPNFCHTVEHLDISKNYLQGPPYWVWSETPKNLRKLNLSGNRNICQSLVDGYLEELLQFNVILDEIDISDCNIRQHVILMSSFRKAKTITFGTSNYSYWTSNRLEYIPCKGLDKCCDIERLNLANLSLYTINSNIDIYVNIIEINLMENDINGLPDEFCNLVNLEVCMLSYNKLLYLPESMGKLRKLKTLCIDNNEVCMVPDTLYELPALRVLDLYNNHISEDVRCIENLEETDLAQNYFEEPNSLEYLTRKEKMRDKYCDRINGRKIEVIRPDSEHSPGTTDDEELLAWLANRDNKEMSVLKPESRASTPEDWDSDEHWIPRYYTHEAPPRSPWLYYVTQKMSEGNFCPMDAHPVSIVEQVRYEKMNNPQEIYESDGQFDDYSDDDS